jgi:hypothetical protein
MEFKKIYQNKFILILIILSTNISCNTVDSDTSKSYPNAGTNQMVTMKYLKDSVNTSTSYNIEVFVVSRSICPENSRCEIPDGIYIAEKMTSTVNNQLLLALRNPMEFKIGSKYLFSIRIELLDNENRYYSLQGYNLIN